MLPAIRFKLLFSPYKMPRCKIGGTLKCRRRGKVPVVAISDAPISWPMTRNRNGTGKPSLILCGDLVRAVKRESEIAVAHHWRVSRLTVWALRKTLGVGPYTRGTLQLHRDWFSEKRDDAAMAKWSASLRSPERAAKIAAAKRGKPRPAHVQAMLRGMWLGKKHSKATRRKMSESQKRLGRIINGRAWRPEEEALLGTDIDRAVAKALGRTWGAVCSRRERLGIPSFRLKRRNAAESSRVH
jgi:hypothetical protein